MLQTKKYLIKVGNDFNSTIIFESNDISECKIFTQEDIKKSIKHHYYSRVLDYDNYICIDYGSWSNFIYVYFFDSSDKYKYLKEVFNIGDWSSYYGLWSVKFIKWY